MTDRLQTQVGPITLRNPIMLASGTCGYGQELTDFIDFNQIGGIVVKGTTLEARAGNATPRIFETPSGMLNAIGLQNQGVDEVIAHKLPWLQQFAGLSVWVNVCGSKIEDYAEVCRRLGQSGLAHAIELNISCPNIKEGGIEFGTRADMAAGVTQACVSASHLPVFVKLSPNVAPADQIAIAQAVMAAGAAGLSMINTLVGMMVDVEKRLPRIATVTGGLSGPAIKPVALAQIHKVYQAIKAPIVGMGGIETLEDLYSFALVGSAAIQVGTSTFIKTDTAMQLLRDLEQDLRRRGETFASYVGGIQLA